MKKPFFLLAISAIWLPSCSILESNLKSKHCKDLETANARLAKENTNLKDLNATLENRVTGAPSDKDLEKIKKYDNLAIKCADAFVTRDSLLKERQSWQKRQKKILADSVNAYQVIAELSVKNKSLEVLKDSLQKELDKCLIDIDLFRASMFQKKTLGTSSSFEKKEAKKAKKEEALAKKEEPMKEEPKKEELSPEKVDKPKTDSISQPAHLELKKEEPKKEESPPKRKEPKFDED
ncbi:MAG TPA: hypothetical protein VJ103_00665 [Candidatus Paceibacterota bacterium]|nr:hypothetical protein [Candidatus Paceibacterota bacterium]